MISTPLVQVILGANWADAAPVLAIVAVAGAIEGISANFYIAFLVVGRPQVMAGFYAFRLAVLIGFAALLAPAHGILGMALAELCGAILSMVVALLALTRAMSISLGNLIAAMWRTLLASAVMAAVLHGIFGLPAAAPSQHSLAVLAGSVTTGGVIYLVAMIALWWISGRPAGAESWAMNRVREAMQPLMQRWQLRR
jgi:O-antigen/teichoic acid export membrane protein